MANVASNSQSVRSGLAESSLRAKAATALLALLPAPVMSQESITTNPEPSIAASATDLSSLALPKADQVQTSQSNGRITLKSGFVIDQRPGIASYGLDPQGRVTEMKFPSGYTISNVTYHAIPSKEDTVASLTITSNGVAKTYTREQNGEELHLTWKVSSPGATPGNIHPDFKGNFAFTHCGEFVISDFSKANSATSFITQVYTAEEKSFGMQQLQTGAYKYLLKDNLLHALRRADSSLITVKYSGTSPSIITEEHHGKALRSWTFEPLTKLWRCSDPNILPSSWCPLFERRTLYYVTADATRVSVATSGAKTLADSDGLTTVMDSSGKVVRIARGAQSRVFTYDESGTLKAIYDKFGSREAPIDSTSDSAANYQGQPSGTLQGQANRTLPPQAEERSNYTNARSIFKRGMQKIVSLPRLLIHPHHPERSDRGICLNGVCPETPPPRDQIGILLPVNSVAIGQESLIIPEISSWTTLDAIEKHRGGTLAPLVHFLRIWAETVSDEDIDAVTSPESLRRLQGTTGDAWLQPELVSPASADYLIWLRDCIKANKLPCTLDVQPLSRAGTPDSRQYGGATDKGVEYLSGALDLSVIIQSLIYEETYIRADLEAMLKLGGTGIYRTDRFQGKSVFDVLFHELQHVFALSTGREYEGTEPIAHLGAFLAMMAITPEKAQQFKPLLNELKNIRRP